ncbi:hypothetical protein [Frankia sp. AgW1.1]|uniref:hypothetical protein n=1 Tax=Frankia sp. AgW1.1 TaxID=1836971 RepID=UPI00193129C2|nr:hypothetical protein [Frankia sp. AgW1.1]MBL7494383.1 hypothetical protein [Frankia sp. AgW1.1]
MDDEPAEISDRELLTRMVDNLVPGALRVMPAEAAVDRAVERIAALNAALEGMHANATKEANHWHGQNARLLAELREARGQLESINGDDIRALQWLWRILAALFPDNPPSLLDDRTIDFAEHEIEGLHNAAGWTTRVRQGSHCADVAHRPNSRGVWVCKLGRNHDGPHRAGRWTWDRGDGPEIRDGD